MRVTLLSHFIGRGGSTALFVQLRDFFQSLGHEASLIVGEDAPHPMAKEYQVVSVPREQGWRARIREYVRLVQQTKPDVVYTISGREEFDALRFLPYPRALHCFCIERHEFSDLPLWHRQLEPYTELRTTNTPDLLERVKGRPRFGIKLAYVPYRLPEVFLAAPDASRLQTPRPDGVVDVCYLGRLDRLQKRSHWLPEIMRRCQAGGAKLHWHIYGSGPAEDRVRLGVAENRLGDLVSFHGWIEPEALATALGQHDLFFLCSRWEGLPAAMVEAMLCGLACVVPDFPAGMTYMVQDGGGWVYEARSPRAAADALLQAVADRELLKCKRGEAQRIARALNAREVIDGHLRHLAKLLQDLKFNGNVESPESAPPLKLVRWPALVERRWLQLRDRIFGPWSR